MSLFASSVLEPTFDLKRKVLSSLYRVFLVVDTSEREDYLIFRDKFDGIYYFERLSDCFVFSPLPL